MAGRGGKGRGRGRGGGGMAVYDLMRSNAEDLGIDEKGITMGQQPPPIWPEIEGGMPALIPMTQDDRNQIEVQRRITKRIRDSPYFLKDVKKIPEIIRWSDRHSVRDVNYEKFHQAIASSSKCMPPECLDVNGTKRSALHSATLKRLRTNSLSERELQALAEIEGKMPVEGRSDTLKRVDQSDEPDFDNDAAEDEFAQDYVEDHYASDDDDGGNDSGNEPVL